MHSEETPPVPRLGHQRQVLHPVAPVPAATKHRDGHLLPLPLPDNVHHAAEPLGVRDVDAPESQHEVADLQPSRFGWGSLRYLSVIDQTNSGLRVGLAVKEEGAHLPGAAKRVFVTMGTSPAQQYRRVGKSSYNRRTPVNTLKTLPHTCVAYASKYRKMERTSPHHSVQSGENSKRAHPVYVKDAASILLHCAGTASG